MRLDTPPAKAFPACAGYGFWAGLSPVADTAGLTRYENVSMRHG